MQITYDDKTFEVRVRIYIDDCEHEVLARRTPVYDMIGAALSAHLLNCIEPANTNDGEEVA
jgi:hypothetical protein